MHTQRARGQERSDDEVIAALAERQHGVVAYRQLIALGVSRRAIQRRVEMGRLHRLSRGVFAVGHRALTRRGRIMAVVLAAGRGAIVSHRTAAELHGTLDGRDGRIHVTVATPRRQRRGVRLHFSEIPDDEREIVDGIPVTTVARTLFDLAGTERAATVEVAYHEAEYLGLTSPVALPALLDRHPRRPGAETLRRLLGRAGRQRKRTEMEADFGLFCDERGIPRPDEWNVDREIHGRRIEADAVYLAQRVIVELDGRSHMTPKRFDDDRARDRANLADGWPTIRVTNRDLDHLRDELATDLIAVLADRS
jgi:hypothetical protein